jgi:hypothetical protein
MTKPKGSLKTGGRKKGTPNQKTLVLKSINEALGVDVPQKLAELLPFLEPDKQADVLLELLNYIYPKRKALEHSGPDGGPIEVQAKRNDVRILIADPDALNAIHVLEEKIRAG